MYALVHNNEIKVGPRQYTRSFFNEYLEEISVESTLPLTYESTDPISINSDIHIVYVETPAIPLYNALTEQLAGPFWDTSKNPITGKYTVVDRPIDAVKNELKAALATNRYNYEVSGTKVTVQNTLVSVDTDRAERNIWAQAFTLLTENAVQRFKFPVEQVWLDLTKPDIGLIVQAIMSHVQSAFDWESEKVSLVDTAVTKSDLEAIDISTPA